MELCKGDGARTEGDQGRCLVGVRAGQAGRPAGNGVWWKALRTWGSHWPVDGHIHHPLHRSHLTALLNCSHSDCLPFFFITTFSPQGLCICCSSCTRTKSFSLHVQMAPYLPCFLLVSSQLSAYRRPSLNTSDKTATCHSLVLLSYPVSPLTTYLNINLFI